MACAPQDGFCHGFYWQWFWAFHVEYFTYGREGVFALGIAHPAVEADLFKPVRQDVLQEAFSEFFDGYAIQFFSVFVGAISPTIGNVSVFDFLYAGIRDGDTMGVAS